MSDVKTAIITHLQLLEEWGLPGFSTDPRWRRRETGVDDAGEHNESVDDARASLGDAGAAGAVADEAAALQDVRADIGDCTRCKLHTLGRSQIVFGVGNPR